MSFIRKQILNLYLHFNNLKRMAITDNRILLVYSMGKVGSSAVYKAIQSALPHSMLYHVHFLSKNYLENLLLQTHSVFHHNITKGKEILQKIEDNPQKTITIVTFVRDPIIRDISDLFQNWNHQFPDIENVDTSELTSVIDKHDHHYVLNWFDVEFKGYLGFDIYKYPFNKTDGYQVYEYEGIKILCLKQELLNVVGSIALKEFLGLDVKLLPANQSLHKKGGSLYNYLRKNYVAPAEKLERVYSSKYVQHFYTEEEISEFISFWSKARQ
jgi:hypothetical protein